MIDHFTLSVSDVTKTRDLYAMLLKPLGYSVKREFPEWKFVGFGDERKPYLWIKEAQPVTTPQHIAFRAKNRAAVDAFYQTAMALGFKDDGAPGPREHYHKDYYGAFVIDPLNGHPLEAVCHDPLETGTSANKPGKKPAAKKAKKPAAKKAKKR
jgi:catechol 2,3-dioxygenase-like lactoylglutathione lyase family enzyme